MDLGIRQIRTAGKGSGSIELTLPAELRDLVGLPCRILLSDGSRPDIVLQPDLRQARAAFAAVWRCMAAALLPDDEDIEFPVAAFTFALQPRSAGIERPVLSWRDGIAFAAAAPHDPRAMSRTITAFGQALAGRLGIAPALAAGFGAACGYLLTGATTTPEGQEACDLVADALRPLVGTNIIDTDHLGQSTPNSLSEITSDAFWRQATPVLTAAADLYQSWTADPSGYAALRAAWRRGRAIEMSGG